MEIQPIVIGTAGHIDHGKSTLVRALTGVDPDRLKEEKERGLTIDLGFAPLPLPDGRTVGLIDVPGHERFIKNMVAGASGIDLVVLVVAADDGVMPQTREHLSIMQLLGVDRGFIALTKIDLVGPELAELAAEDVRESVRGTFLEDAPLHPVSAVTGEGLDALKERLFQMAGEAPPRSAEGLFRMPVQRVFSARGFGTVLTGVPVSGQVKVGEVLELLPGGRKGKVRGIQAYREKSDTARAGHSAAINLADVEHHTVERGMVLATPGYFGPVRMVGVRLTALPDLDRTVSNRMPVRFHTGTAEVVGEVVLLDVEELQPGETALAQVRLKDPVVCAPGDRFVLRLASPLLTLGGGEVLEESRHRLKRFKRFVIEELSLQAESLTSELSLLEALLARTHRRLARLDELAVAVKRPKQETEAWLAELVEKGRVAALGAGTNTRYAHPERLSEMVAVVQGAIARYFEENPLREVLDVRDLRNAVDLDKDLLAFLLELLAERGEVRQNSGGLIELSGRRVELDPETEALRGKVLEQLDQAGFQPPSVEDLTAQLGAKRAAVDSVLALLVDQGAVDHVTGGLYLSAAALERARAAIVRNCEKNGQLAIPELRDELQTTRKFLIPLLEHFDAQGLTLRQGGTRVLKRR